MTLEKILNHPDSSLSAVSSPSYQLSRVPLIDEHILQCTPFPVPLRKRSVPRSLPRNLVTRPPYNIDVCN